MNKLYFLSKIALFKKLKTPAAGIASFLLISSLFAMMLHFSWRKWSDLLIDFGRELYVPWQINNGAVLYKDIFHMYGPLSDYLNSCLFKVFGTQVMTLAIFNICLAALLTYFIYGIFLKTTNRLTATAASAIFVSVFAFSQYVWVANYNFACPYSYEITHGIFLSFASIYIFILYLKRRKLYLIAGLGIVMGVTFLTKVEPFVAIFSAMLAGLLFDFLTESLAPKKILSYSTALLLGFITPPAAFTLYFCSFAGIKEAIRYIMLPYRILLNSPITSHNIFYKRVLGADALSSNVSKLFITAGWLSLTIAIIFLTAYLINRIKAKVPRNLTITALLIILLLSAPMMLKKILWLDICRPLPLVMLLLILYLGIKLIRCRKNKKEKQRLLPLLVLAVFSFILLLKIAFNTHVFHYGFVLAMPGTLLSVMLFLYQAPILSGYLGGNKVFARLAAVILIGIFITAHINISRYVYSLKDYPVGSGGDGIVTFNPKLSDTGIIINDFLLKTSKLILARETFVVLPEGVMFNYILRHRNPSAYLEFTPQILETYNEDKIIAAFSKNPPDYIVLAERDNTEHGYRYFGRDYGLKLFSWLKANYTAIDLSGNMPLCGEGFGIIIAKHNK